ncbi:MAG: hypothetical protein QG599_3879 [Pseudomonadota bacterium]|nr:hypothetical protein [Pseudomonadota bacterium]
MRLMINRQRIPTSHFYWPTAIAGLMLMAGLLALSTLPHDTAPLPHSAYLWQRNWSGSLREAVQRNQPFIAEWAALAAEVEFQPDAPPRLAKVALDHASLRTSGRPVSLVIRIAPWAGAFDRSQPQTQFLIHLAQSLLNDARRQGLEPAHLQLDFDAATRQLDDYRHWLDAMREAIAPTPLTITTLPTWLNSPAFPRLIQSVDSYILQVHSWEAPRRPDQPFTLCDPDQAKRAIQQAAQLGRPFQVALPTYGYRAWFDSQHRLLGLSAEGPALNASPDAQVREVRADPVAMAQLVRWLHIHRPENLHGIIWYRLPLPEDRLSWNERTWRTVMQGQTPAPRTAWVLKKSADGLIEVAFDATGEADSLLTTPLTLHWRQAQLIAADGLAGFTVQRLAPDALRLQPPRRELLRLAPGQQQLIGWLRFSQPPEISVHVDTPLPR